MALAIFDLDNTLLAGDSDYEWGQFLVDRGIVDGEEYARENLRFYRDYQAGRLDIQAFLAFSLRPLASHEPRQLRAWRAEFVEQRIVPMILPRGLELVRRHRESGDTTLIITATNRFVTAPIAERLGVHALLATEVEEIDGHFTGASWGIPCFQKGKILRLEEWLVGHGGSLDGSWFYSDSHNDLPLLERVSHPVAVNPDSSLESTARQRHWPILDLRQTDAMENQS